jgi:hypothetical protein
MLAWPRKPAAWTANQRRRVILNKDVRKGFEVGSAYDALYSDYLVFMFFLIEVDDRHDLVLGKIEDKEDVVFSAGLGSEQVSEEEAVQAFNFFKAVLCFI